MDIKIKALFFVVAVVLFVLEAIGWRPRAAHKPQWGWAGLAVFASVFAVDALVAA